MSLLSELAGCIAETPFERLPGYVVEAGKSRILDTVGGGVWGRHEGKADRLIELAEESGGPSDAVVWGEKRKVSAPWAAFINAYSSFYVSDTDRFCGAHGGAVVVPAAMAVGEQQGVSGRDFIAAVIMGYEALSRIGLAIYPAASRRGFHVTGLLGPIGSAAAVSRVLRLNREQTTNALSIAAQAGMGLGEAFQYLETVSLNIGRISQAGITAALLARAGFRSSDAMLEGGNFIKDGFLSAVAGGFDPGLVTTGLGADYMIANSAPKIHWGCRHLAPATDAVMEMVSKYGLNTSDIEEIRVRQYSEAFRLERKEVKTRDDAIWSSRFTIAVALTTGEPAYPSQFTEEAVSDGAIRAIMAKVKIEGDPELDKEFPRKWPSRVEIVTKDGRSYEEVIDFPRGEPENPVSKAELDGKFRALVEPDLGNAAAERMIDVVANLEKRPLSDLASLL